MTAEDVLLALLASAYRPGSSPSKESVAMQRVRSRLDQSTWPGRLLEHLMGYRGVPIESDFR